MGVKVSPLGSDAVVEIADESVEAYTAAGWSVVDKPSEKSTKKTPAKASK